MKSRPLGGAGNGIIIKGFVSEEELAQLYGHCRVVVVPLRYGAGVKGKVVEAIYQRSAHCDHIHRGRGIPFADHVLEIEDQAELFAGKTVKLYQDNERFKPALPQDPGLY